MIRYGEEHVWVRCVEDEAVLGLSCHAQTQLGDVVFVDHACPGCVLEPGALIACVESVKTVIEVHTPIGGMVTGINRVLNRCPSLINDDPEGTGWILRLQLDSRDEVHRLMRPDAYADFVQSQTMAL
ncbi:MAG: glycine cleavage system protein H [Pseudomonadota bacterium]